MVINFRILKCTGGGGGGGGSTAVIKPLSIKENGTYLPGAGVNGYAPVDVDVQPPLEEVNITKNGTYTPSEGMYGINKITVDVTATKMYLREHPYLRLSHYKNTTLEPFFDLTGVTSIENMFCESSLNTIPDFKLKVDYCYNAFNECAGLESIPYIDISECTSLGSMFNGCLSLKTIPPLITSNADYTAYLFSGCTRLETLPELDFGKVNDVSQMLYNCRALTNVGGLKNLKISLTSNSGFKNCPNLTKQSMLNIINDLYDFRGNGDPDTIKEISFKQNCIDLLTPEEQAIATNKGWTIKAE